MSDETILTHVYDLLYHLGLTANYTGFFHTAYAVLLTCREPDRMRLATKWLYPEVADHYKTTWQAVERNIRYSISLLWAEHPNRLSKLAGYIIIKRPTPARFIAILSANLPK